VHHLLAYDFVEHFIASTPIHSIAVVVDAPPAPVVDSS
jgi:hypothetical protein